MLLHLGNDQIVFTQDIEFILDYNECKNNKDSICFLNEIKKKAKVIDVYNQEIKSVILLNNFTDNFVGGKTKNLDNNLVLYYSPISSKTLFKRSEKNIKEYSLNIENFESLKWDNNL